MKYLLSIVFILNFLGCKHQSSLEEKHTSLREKYSKCEALKEQLLNNIREDGVNYNSLELELDRYKGKLSNLKKKINDYKWLRKQLYQLGKEVIEEEKKNKFLKDFYKNCKKEGYCFIK